jgi:hypothetical protein
MEANKMQCNNWIRAFYLATDITTGSYSHYINTKLCVNCRTVLLVQNKIMHGMSERDDSYVLPRKIQLDASYPGGKNNGGKAGRGSENKVPIVSAVSIDDAGYPIHVVAKVQTFSIATVADWTQNHLAQGCEVISEGLVCFPAVAKVGCIHKPVNVNGRHPKDLS